MFPPSSNQLSKVSPSASIWPQAAPLVSLDHRSSSISASDTSPSINKLFTMPLNADHLSGPAFSENFFGNRIYVDNQGTLNIVNATPSDSGYYACALVSSVGSVLATAKLMIKQTNFGSTNLYDPSIINDPSSMARGGVASSISKFDLLPPPVIKLGSAQQTLPINTSATLNCEVVSQVTYKIQWFFENQPLQEELNRVVVSENGTLIIDNLRLSDSGTYTCVVTPATDQTIPLASPFETLDSSMLTSAPPVQQTTSHSTTLKVASPMNPNIHFKRVDKFDYPSSPGPAQFVSANGNDAITISWAAPADSGTLPIREYIIEHFDTAQDHMGWRVIYNIKGKESLLIDGLSPDGSHFFVIRAANGHGVGPSSAIAGPMRTVSGEARYQQELQRRRDPYKKVNLDLTSTNSLRPEASMARDRLKTVSTSLITLTPTSSSSIRLQWSTQVTGNLSNPYESPIGFSVPNVPDGTEFLEGYSIRYRPIGSGESLTTRDPLANVNSNMPLSLPLVTSYIDEREEASVRDKRDLQNFYDYPQEFNEVRVIDQNTQMFTVNGLKPFTLYQFFVVPYYKDIDGVPSNHLAAQTNEDRPSVAPPNLTVHPINNTAVRLLWLHIPPAYANGVLQGYMVQFNRSDIVNGQQVDSAAGPLLQASKSDAPKVLSIPLSSVNIVPLGPISTDMRPYPYINNLQQYVVMYDLPNLSYKSFYSLQVSGFTNSGPGPWSEQNFIMDPVILSQLRVNGNEIDDVMSKTLISSGPHTYVRGGPISDSFALACFGAVGILILLIIFFFAQSHRQGVRTWKKSIKEHFNNKFYLPSTGNSSALNSVQQNIYDHQQHLIYSGSAQMNHQVVGSQVLWANNGCLTSSGTGSISSHGGSLAISTNPTSQNQAIASEPVLLMNGKDMNSRFIKCQTANQRPNPVMAESIRGFNHHHEPLVHQGDYYSVINGMAEYEELDPQQRSNMQAMANFDRHQTASSNSDTSCPTSVTRLLPNGNYNREVLTRKFADNMAHEQIMRQTHMTSSDGKPVFQALTNGLSPYATANLANQTSMHQQMLANHQMTLIDTSRPMNFIMHSNGATTMDDNSRAFLGRQQVNGAHHPSNVFRTLQRNPVNQPTRINNQFVPMQSHAPNNTNDGSNARPANQSYIPDQYQGATATNIMANPLAEVKSNFYEPIEYCDKLASQPQSCQAQNRFVSNAASAAAAAVSSSTSSGSMQTSPDTQNSGKLRRISQPANDTEAHDLRVFSSSRDLQSAADKQQQDRFRGGDDADAGADADADESTALRPRVGPEDTGRSRQMSKRKRLQQRNRLHINQGDD